MSTTGRIPQLWNTLYRWALLPSGDGNAAQSPPTRPVPRRSPLLRVRAADLALTVVALVLAVWNSAQNPYMGPATPWVNLLLATVSALPLLLRRRAPELVLGLGLLAKVLQISTYVTPLAFYAEGAYRGPHSRKTVWASAGVGLLILTPWDAEAWSSLRTVALWFAVNFVFICLVPLLLGLYVGQRRAVVAGLVERAERAEREQRLVAEAAREQERRRIAGEMHDVVSHQVSLIVVHANALSAVAHDPTVTGETAQIIQTAGRRALTELREMLGLLRSGPGPDSGPGSGPDSGPGSGTGGPGGPGRPSTEAGEPPAPAGNDVAEGDPAADRRSAPGAAVDRITELADGSRTAGLPVTVLVEGAPQPLAEQVERAAHRVVQEALTNVHKHAPGATTRIRLAFDPRNVRVRIDNGPPGKPPEPTADGGPLLPSGGHGLIGLTERVRLAGGTIESGPTSDGGFCIDAALPTSATAATTTGGATTGAATTGATATGS
ncbi:sensor histidine kinase [Streptomyces tsukubensis]|uniref:histidine kinase n=1 Tax=Streptomyces tsukubensis TaxID=83656 RepID=A0A1V4A4F9_9ACTN|nr:histidine kinase [Streptomyces tsukubensis]OON75597.1 two-component sensor histidine kinase [Streptomyces tsukubensis]